jgi:ureidoglycolate hydrolase
MSLRRLIAQPITVDNFRPFGQVIFPQSDDTAFGPADAQLTLNAGIPRFYIMRLHQRGTRFHTITRHCRCTQCLGSLEGQIWWLAVAPPSPASAPKPEEVTAFQIPGNCFIKLAVGTWHAGPYFAAETVNFYNLELSDTNIADHDTCDLQVLYQLEFQII